MKNLFIGLLAIGWCITVYYVLQMPNQPIEKTEYIVETDTIIYYLTNPKTVTATCYRATVGQCDATPFITANNSHIDTSRIDQLRWIALSRDLEKHFKMNDSVMISGCRVKHFNGVWYVKDRMNRRFRDKIDFLISDTIQADLFKNVKISKILFGNKE